MGLEITIANTNNNAPAIEFSLNLTKRLLMKYCLNLCTLNLVRVSKLGNKSKMHESKCCPVILIGGSEFEQHAANYFENFVLLIIRQNQPQNSGRGKRRSFMFSYEIGKFFG